MYKVRLFDIKNSKNVDAYEQWYDKYGFDFFYGNTNVSDESVLDITFNEYKKWVNYEV